MAGDVTCRKVGIGNEEVFAFYERYGFYPRQTVLERVEKKSK
jgi:hypothetical protein